MTQGGGCGIVYKYNHDIKTNASDAQPLEKRDIGMTENKLQFQHDSLNGRDQQENTSSKAIGLQIRNAMSPMTVSRHT